MAEHLFKRAILLISILVAAVSSLLATEQDDPRFVQWMENSRAASANNHMIAYVKLESLEGKVPSEECRYDRYPGKVERIQLPSGLSYARKKGKKWIESDDWEESGKTVKRRKSHNSIIGWPGSMSRAVISLTIVAMRSAIRIACPRE